MKRRAAGLTPVMSEHQHAKLLPEQLKWFWKRYPERYSIALSKCSLFFCHFILWKKGQLVLFPDPVICLCASGTPLVKITSRILPDVHYLLTSHERRWKVWLNKWVICVLGWWCVLFIIFFANPGSSNLQLFLFDPK